MRGRRPVHIDILLERFGTVQGGVAAMIFAIVRDSAGFMESSPRSPRAVVKAAAPRDGATRKLQENLPDRDNPARRDKGLRAGRWGRSGNDRAARIFAGCRLVRGGLCPHR